MTFIMNFGGFLVSYYLRLRFDFRESPFFFFCSSSIVTPGLLRRA